MLSVKAILVAIDRRLRNARPGSVLIIVIVLLLLLAILGAAYISTTRSARVASAQNVLNSDVDTVLSGISKVCEGTIVDDLNDNFGNLEGIDPGPTQNVHSVYQGTYNPNGPYNNPSLTYNVGDIVSVAATVGPPATPTYYYVATKTPTGAPSPTSTATGWTLITHVPGATSALTQAWLADRIPTPDGGYVSGNITPNLLTAYWPNISQMAPPSGGTTPTSILGTPFESPDGTSMPTLNPGATLAGTMGANLMPDFKKLGTAANPIYVPALDYGGGPPLVAGDADGDGIADCLLFRIPGATLDGLTWYAGVRIIDNNSAVNMSTAVSRDYEYTITGGALTAGGSNYYALFPSSVGLGGVGGYELLNKNDLTTNFANFNAYRIGALASLGPLADAAPGAASPTLPLARSDFQFSTGGDLLYNQLIRRISNPGFNGNANGTRCQALPLSDEAALAYRFCLVRPDTVLSGIPAGVSENLLPFSLAYYQAPVGGSPGSPAKFYQSLPYGSNPTTDVTTWFNDNFNYDSAPPVVGAQPIRPLLVSRNPVSNYITPVYDSNTNNTGEPLDPFSAINPPPTGVIPGMMLPYGTGPSNYTHFRGRWSPNTAPQNTTYKFNDIVVGGDGYTYMWVVPPSLGANNSAVAPTLANLPPNASGQPLYIAWQFQPWTKSPVKANVNTATFRELYRAFWSVMSGNPTGQTPFGADTVVDANPYWPDSGAYGTPNPQHQFRSPLRDPTYSTGQSNSATNLSPANTMLLRAALAAVNVLGLRDNSQNVISRTVYLYANIAVFRNATTPVMARVYSNAPQPFISEVYANADQTPSTPQGYVAIELYNPYSAPMVLTNWQIGMVNRSGSGSGYPRLTFVTNTGLPALSVIAPPNSVTTQMQAQNDPRPDPLKSTPGNPVYDYAVPPAGTIIVPAHGYALLENYNANGKTAATGDATSRPPSAQFMTGSPATTPAQTGIWYGPLGASSPNTCDVYVPGLQLLIQGTTGATYTKTAPPTSPGGEFVLLRPRRSDGAFTSSSDPLNTFTEGSSIAPNLYDLVPVDSYDFTGLQVVASGPSTAWSYVRIKGAAQTTWFKQVYPGRYTVTALQREANTGTDQEPAATWIGPSTATPLFGQDATTACYTNNFPPIQVYNLLAPGNTSGFSSHWPNPLLYPALSGANGQTVAITNTNGSGPQQWPFGTFARNGDLLDVPYIGAYQISLANEAPEPSDFVELNSLPKDCSFADATYSDSGDSADQKLENIGRFCPIQARPTPTAGWTQPDYYAWTRNLYAYLTVQSPSDAQMPNFDPNINDVVNYNDATPAPVPNIYKYPAAAPPPTPAPSQVLVADATAPDQSSQANVGVEGLVNINTASWKVLSMLPMVTKNEDTGYVAHNESLAKAIVSWRIAHGPFTSIYDLNSVIDYYSTGAYVASSTTGFQNAEGHLAIANGGGASGVSSLNGLLSPPDPLFPSATGTPGTASGVAEDYQSDFAMLSRISNLITTRSDTFTVYIEVQGWQNVGVTNPSNPSQSLAQPMITRRYAFIVDRSAINGDPNSRFLKTVTVPND